MKKVQTFDVHNSERWERILKARETKKKKNALKVLEALEAVALLEPEDLKDALDVYGFDTVEHEIRLILSRWELFEEFGGLVDLYNELLNEEK